MTRRILGLGAAIPSEIRREMRSLAAAHVFLGIALPAVVVAGSVWADQGWTNTGPQGGPIFVLTVDPQNPGTFYAGTFTGVFKSLDAGATWANAGMSGWSVTRLLVDPQDSSTLYALTAGHPGDDDAIIQAFQSTDGGATWNQTGTLPNSCCAVFTFDPQGTLYVAGYYPQRDLLTSTDGGATWNTAGSLPVNYGFADLAIDPQNAGTLYAASVGNLGGRTVGTLFKSTDGGATWSQTGSGLATSNADFFVQVLFSSNSNPVRFNSFPNSFKLAFAFSYDMNSSLSRIYVFSVALKRPTSPTRSQKTR